MANKKSSGTLTQKFELIINIDNYIDELITNIITATESVIEDIAKNCNIDRNYSEEDFGEYQTNGTYDTTYSSEHFDGSWECPHEDSFDKMIESLDEDKINELVKIKLANELDVKTIIDKLTLSITEDEDDIETEEYEPDWDSMPGGHDYDND